MTLAPPSKVECFAADAASDEQLAGRELSGHLAGATVAEIRDAVIKELPNLKAPQCIASPHNGANLQYVRMAKALLTNVVAVAM